MELADRNLAHQSTSDNLRIAIGRPDAAGRAQWTLVGELDGAEIARLHDMAAAALSDGVPRLVAIDAGDLSFVDSAGIRALLTVRESVLAAGAELRLDRAHEAVHQVLRITGLLDLFGLAGDPPTGS